jgi:hypothetical protein
LNSSFLLSLRAKRSNLDQEKRRETGMAEDTYEIYALRYAHLHRQASENFLGGDTHA